MVEFQLNGYTKELEFGYSTKMEGYTNLSSDMNKLYEVADSFLILRLRIKEDKGGTYGL